MYTIKKTALNVLGIAGDDERSQYRRGVCVYAFSISLLFPPPLGGLTNISASKIVSAARTIAAARLFDYRVFNLDSAWNISETEVSGLKIPRKTLRPRAAFQDDIVRSLFSNLFNPKGGITSLLRTVDFDFVEGQFDKRIEEMDAMADLINIYMLCAPEIKRRSRSNGLDIVIKLYQDCLEAETGERTLANNWRRLKTAAIFHYLYKYQDRAHPVFSTPSAKLDDFVQKVLTMSEFSSFLKLCQSHDYVSAQLNDLFSLSLPVISSPPPSLELRGNPDYRDKLLALLK
jgi:hypothetical protein